jgi:hypothetical protein
MRRMACHRALHPLAVVSLLSLFGCGSDETVLSLNVTLRQSASSARTLTVNITQPGQSAVDATIPIETKETDAGTVPKNTTFFHRIVLPDSYVEAQATGTVVAKDAEGADIATVTGMAMILPGETVAGYVTLGEDPPPPPAPADDAGTGM